MNSKKVIVIGGAGYIGSHTVYQLVDQGYEVVVIDNLSKGSRMLLDHADAQNCTFEEVDLLDYSMLEHIIEQHKDAQAVVHCAAAIEVGESVLNPAKYYTQNVLGTMNVLEAMVTYGIKELIFSSTAAVYGIPTSVPIGEDDTKDPINPYGNTKLAMERMIADYSAAYDMKSVIFRYFNACGADSKGRSGYVYDPATHLIPIVCEVAVGQRSHLGVYGNDYNTPDGTCVRDYVHVEDIARAHVLGLEHAHNQEGSYVDSFNLGTQSGYSVQEIIDATNKLIEKPLVIKHTERRAGDPDSLIAQSEKARLVLGWKPKSSDLETIISSALAWKKKMVERKK